MFTSTARGHDHKLLQKSNLTARQPHWALITSYISFNNRRLLANEGLVNFTGYTERELGSPAPRATCYPQLYGLDQWCTTSGPQTTSGPRRLVIWPSRKIPLFSTRQLRPKSLQLHTPLISRHLYDLYPKIKARPT